MFNSHPCGEGFPRRRSAVDSIMRSLGPDDAIMTIAGDEVGMHVLRHASNHLLGEALTETTAWTEYDQAREDARTLISSCERQTMRGEE